MSTPQDRGPAGEVPPRPPLRGQALRGQAPHGGPARGLSRRQPPRDKARMAEAWLAVLDGLEISMYEAGGRFDLDPADVGGQYRAGRVMDGVQAVHDQAVRMLDALGYARHDETGVPFDPDRHRVVRVEPDSGAPAGTVVEVLRPGYGDGDEQLRPAAVVVAGGSAGGRLRIGGRLR
jgi:molecular chaperone GrpE